MLENSPAIKGFDRSVVAEYLRMSTKPVLKAAMCSVRQKSHPLKFRRIEQINIVALNTGFFVAVLPTIFSEPLIMQGCRKANCIKAGVSPLPLIGYTDSINHHNTHFATTASRNGYNDNLAKPDLFDEQWGGGFIQPIAVRIK